MRLHFVLLFLLTYLFSNAQLETRNWFYGQSRLAITPSGITTGLPTPDPNLFFLSYRTSSLSDASGNLLIATNGMTIIDRNLSIMPALDNINLHGGNGNVLIQQIPGSTRYYVFYIVKNDPNDLNASSTLKYAIVDLSLNAGNGDVTIYDQVVDANSSSSFSLASGSNPSESWLVTHKCSTDSFFNYKITSAGLSNTPVISKAGTVSAIDNYIFRDMKTSPDGKLIACVAYKDYSGFFAVTNGFIEVFDFNSISGTMTSRVRNLRRVGYFYSGLTLEFSPDNRLLYSCQIMRIDGLQPCGFGSGAMTQFNLCYTDSIEFDRYSMTVASDFKMCQPFTSWGPVQLGADKRIHMPYSGVTVSTINNPNRIGSYCNYVFDSYHVSTNNFGFITTPTYYHKTLEKAVKNNIIYDGGCFPNPITFHVTNDTITSIDWNFGDPGSAINTASQVSPSHIFSAPGRFTVSAQLYNSQHVLIETLTELVEIKDPGKRILENYPRDTSFCIGLALELKPDSLVNGIYHWYQLDASRTIYNSYIGDTYGISYSGKWFVEMKQNGCNGCTKLDSIQVTVLPKPSFSLGADRNLCQGDSISLIFYDPDASYTWSTGSSAMSINVKQGGLYWLEQEYNNNGCTTRDSILITQVPAVNFSLPGDTTLCGDQLLLLAPAVSNASYIWQDASTNNSFTVEEPGTYWVRITSADYCTKSDTITINYLYPQQANLGNDTTLCIGGSLVLHANIPNADYKWSTGSVNAQITVTQPGDYWVKIDNGGCSVADTISIAFNTPPALFLGKDTTLCKNENLVLNPAITNATYTWQDGSHNNSLIVQQPGSYWLEVKQNSCVARDTIIVEYYAVPDINLGPDLKFCVVSNVVLNASSGFSQYDWSNGLTGQQITVTAPATYRVTGTTPDGCKANDTLVVGLYPKAVVELGAPIMLCKGENRQLNAGAGFTQYAWNTGSTDQIITTSSIGEYSVVVTDGNGCRGYDTTQVNGILPLPANFLPKDTAICSYGNLLLIPLSAYSQYSWSTGSNESSITVTSQGTYWLMVRDNNNCQGKDTITVGVKDCMTGLFVPNAFTPNHDGNNDLFRPMLFGSIKKYHFAIYNRWGSIIFQSDVPGKGWDGNNAGILQGNEVYIWTCKYQLNGEPVKQEKGTFVLLR